MTEVILKKQRPKHLALNQIRLPLPGIVSILHRVSGVGLFLMLPVMLSLFGNSVGSPESYATYKATVGYLPVKIVLWGLLWAYLHHFCAGIRFLLLDMHKGIDLPSARLSARIVLIVSLTLTVLLGVKLW
ncbi:MAG TPA: succinate dehydrogenase, cytochrome b556 subunit [Zoogloea sp.]|jgi:succinate dehydrogenase / fumarate reductase cytochrome b subunit|uniref:succinate dehydrogenase, cytochrome b556 subunit n=1 Tax=Zoogloea sp. TaxID=49181 RepID=UPI002BAF3C7D|nr:succinate dehydrogenase, cytochrome b556 subunit [Zoogloea sp.]HOB44677.1 succinate dehydrogenase, cytochrome b556 subunit [Zoogloea sp.]HQA08698.1 succinate dehydrogenase, cytochrome b556 subunit [Zoogloea sp.]HQE40893.1 succinate dehydrogenase, cytochrome b556 subunit [Zoogloea sp.]